MKKMMAIVLSIVTFCVVLNAYAYDLDYDTRAGSFIPIWSDNFELYPLGEVQGKENTSISTEEGITMWRATTKNAPYETFSILNSPVEDDGRGKTLCFKLANNLEFQSSTEELKSKKHIKLSFDFYMEVPRYLQLRLFGTSTSSLWNVFSVNNGKVYISGALAGNLVTNVWHHVDIYLDFDKNLSDVYYDETILKQDLQISNITCLSNGRFTVYAETDPEIYIDNFEISALDDFNFVDASVSDGFENASVFLDKIQFNFSTPLDGTSLEMVSLKKGEEKFSDFSVSADKKCLTINFSDILGFDQEYTILLNGIKDVFGRTLQGFDGLKFKTIPMGITCDNVVFNADGSNLSASLHIINPTAESKEFDLYMVKYNDDGQISENGIVVKSCEIGAGISNNDAESLFTIKAALPSENESVVVFLCTKEDYPKLFVDYFAEYNNQTQHLTEKGDTTITVEQFDIENTDSADIINISGVVSNNKQKTVLLCVRDANSNINMLVPVYTKTDGSFDYHYSLGSDATEGSYTLKINSEEFSNGTVYYIKSTNREQLVGSVNGSTEDTFTSDLVSTMENLKATLLAANPQLKEKAFQVGNYRVLYEQKPYSNYSDLIAKLKEIDDLGTTVESADWVKLKDVIETNKALIFNNDFTLYNKVIALRDNSIYQKMVNDNLKTVYDIRQSMQNAYDSYMPPELNTGINSGGSGGGGSYSGGSISSIKTQGNGTNSNNANSQSNEPFSDLENALWAKESIVTLYKNNIISGDGDGQFRPNDSIKREEFVKLLCCAFDLKLNYMGKQSDFSDVEKDKWYYDYLNIAIQNNIISGKDDGSFGIGENISREDMAVLLYRAMIKKGYAAPAETDGMFSDFDTISVYAREAVTALSSMGIINGVGDNLFAPLNTANRAQAAQIIFNACFKN